MAYKYCPYCHRIVETRVISTKYSQIRYQNIFIKRRQIAHRSEEGGCMNTWFTLEAPENVLRRVLNFNDE